MTTVSEVRDVAAFDGIELKGAGVLHFTQGDTTSVRIEAEPDTLSRITTEVEGNRLVIRFRWLDVLFAFKPMGPIDIHVTSPQLRAVKISGSGRLLGETPIRTDRLYVSLSGSGKVVLDVDTDDLRAVVSGAGDFELKGRATRQEISVSGTCDYLAAGLATKDTDISIAGSGRAQLDASEHLDVSISGSGRVEYSGAAQVTQRISGSGSILRLAEPQPKPEAAAEPAADDAAEPAAATVAEPAAEPTSAPTAEPSPESSPVEGDA